VRGSKAWRAIAAAVLMGLLAGSACGTSTPSAQGSTPDGTEASSTSATPAWDLVLMGDSVLLQPGPTLQARLERELGVNLRLSDWINPDQSKYTQGGERSADLVTRLRTDEKLRADLRDAEIIAFDVPTGIVNDVCTGDPSTSTVEEAASCMDEAVALYTPDVQAVFEELVALRDPAQAMIRVTDVWQFLYPTFVAAGTYDVVRPRWQEMNQAVHDAAARYGIPVVTSYEEFSGQDGDRDPVASGDVQEDQFHLTQQGVDRFVDLLVSGGFEPLTARRALLGAAVPG
jgi:lysophospholipase L1-like esterase